MAAISAFWLTGCFTYPDIPESIEKDNFTGLKSKEHRRLPESCKTLTLDLSREVALANNPDYASAKYAVTAAWSRFYQAFANYLPTVTANYGMTEYYYTPASQGGDGKKNIYDNKGGNINVQWVIFDGLVTTMNTLSARYSAKQAEDLNRDARRLLILGVINAYNNVLRSKAQIRIAQQDYEFQNQLLNETEIKYKAGAVSLSEPLNFKVNANNAESALITTKFNFYVNKCVLASLLGLTDGEIPEDISFPELGDQHDQFPIDVSVYLDTALRNRPDLMAFRNALSAAKFNLYAAYGAFLPTITTFVTPGYARTDQGYSGRYHIRPHTQDRSLNYGFTASWELFSGGQNLALLYQNRALLAQSELGLMSKWITVVTEVRQSYENCKQYLSQVNLYKENFELYKKTRDLVEQEYRAGNTSITRVNESQRDLVRAENDLVNFEIGLENAKAQLNAAIGSE